MKTHKTVILTNQKIKDIKPFKKGAKRKYLRDTKAEGLRLMVTPTGAKSFQYYSWVKGYGPFTYTIGKVEKVTLALARDKARLINSELILHGADAIPGIKGEMQQLEPVFSELFDLYIAEKISEGKRDTDNIVSRYNAHILPTIGKKKISALTPAYMKRWHLKLPLRKKVKGKKGTISTTTANRCMALVRAVFNSQCPEMINPCSLIKKFPEASRERYLSGPELNRLFEALDQADTDTLFKDVIMILLTTGARKNNVYSMRWADIDLENGMWIIPAGSSKNNASMGIPLIQEAITILERRKPTRSPGSVFVFPGSGRTGHIINIDKPWKKLLAAAGIEDFHLHDLRRTMGSWQAHIGSSDLIIGKSLGHKSIQATRVYSRIRDSNPIKDSMQRGFDAMKDAASRKK